MSNLYNDLRGTWEEYEASPCASLRDRFIGAARIYFQREKHSQREGSLCAMLDHVRKYGLSHWVPDTEQGRTNKADMLSRIESVLRGEAQPDIAELTSALEKTVAENKFLDGRCEALTLSVYDWRVQWQQAMDRVRYLERQVEVLENAAAFGERP